MVLITEMLYNSSSLNDDMHKLAETFCLWIGGLGLILAFEGQTMPTHVENNLAKEKSPYLKSAAHQPVQWYAWSDEAFKKAKELDRPILLDIGAVWCHWCHVIDRESYENSEIAKTINEYFIPIKVDRDERPDIDSRYQLAVNAISGQGGWPLTAFLTPDGNVFYGGTYFPPEDKYGRPGFKTILKRIADIYKEKREDIHQDAQRLHQALKENSESATPVETISAELIDDVIRTMHRAFDSTHGGFGNAPKFPHTNAIELGINRYFFTRESWIKEIIAKTLTEMGKGGVYDQVGGGFHRYSTDDHWLVPHFEKMSYDNSELLKNYVHGYQLTQDPFFKEIALGIMSFVKNVISDQERDGFYASQDADINLEDDGDYFTWTKQETEAVLTADEAKIAISYYDIGEQGEMHQNPAKNVLFIAKDIPTVAKETGLSEDMVVKSISKIKAKMLEARNKRPTPYVDRTLYANWNGMMIQAYLEAYKGLGDEKTRDFALKTLDFLIQNAYSEKTGFYHVYVENESRIAGFFDDQIQMTNALLSAYEITSNPKYLDLAKKVTDLSIKKFWDNKSSGFFDIEEPKEAIGKLSIRQKSIQDSPTPSANGVAAFVLDKLYFFTEDASYQEKAEQTLKAFASQVGHLGFFAATYTLALDFHLKGPLKILIVGEDSKALEVLRDTALKTFHPYKVVQVVNAKEVTAAKIDSAIRQVLDTQKDFKQTKAYVCEGKTCRPPVSDAAALKDLIASPIAP